MGPPLTFAPRGVPHPAQQCHQLAAIADPQAEGIGAPPEVLQDRPNPGVKAGDRSPPCGEGGVQNGGGLGDNVGTPKGGPKGGGMGARWDPIWRPMRSQWELSGIQYGAP